MPIALRNAVDDDESSETAYRHIAPEELAGLDPNTVTLLDLREPADFAAHPVPSMRRSTRWPMCSRPCPRTGQSSSIVRKDGGARKSQKSLPIEAMTWPV